MDRRQLLVRGVAASAVLALRPALARARESVLGGPCEGCDWVFDGLPDTLTSHSRIAPADAPGAPMTLTGRVTTPRGAAAPGVIVYAYHTDHTGIYPAARNRHGRLRGWAVTDAHGRYRFDSIRPAAYPGRQVAEHVHMHVIEPGVGTYYIDNVLFEDDELLTAADRRGAQRGGAGLVMPRRVQGVWQVRRDISLGLHIEDHPGG
jgi:protocatechuate 3,4-dioxygenase beta subunit